MDDKFPKDLRYTDDHEWASLSDNTATIGITHHAQEALGEVVFVDLPTVGTEITKGDTFGAVESIKAVSDLYAPISGKIIEVNSELSDEPGNVNADPYGDAWMIRVELSDSSELEDLLDADSYAELVESL